MGDTNALTIEAVPVSRTMTTLTVRLAGEVLHIDKIDLAKPKARDAFAAAVSGGRPGIDRDELARQLLQLADAQSRRQAEQPHSIPTRQELVERMPQSVRAAAQAMLEDPNLVRRIVDDISAVGVAGERELSLTLYLIGTSRLLKRPVSGIVQGPTASGKSYTIDCVAGLFPPETVLLATQMTPQALFYMAPHSLEHRFVVGGERSRTEDDDAAEATRALREMLSAGKLSKLIPMKTDGAMKTVLVEQEGPIAYIESTTLSKIFDEDLNRCILLTTDERQSQTRRIINAIAEKFTGNGTNTSCDAVIQCHHALQRLIEPHSVLIPFASTLAEHFGDERIEARRAFPHTLSLIQASALLHQYQRQWLDGHVLADANDYHLVRRLLSGPLARQLGGGLSDPARRFLERLSPLVKSEVFTTRDAFQHVKGGDRSVRGWLSELADAGLAKVIEPQRGPIPAVWKVVGTVEDAAVCHVLPPVEALFPEQACRLADNAQTLTRQAV